VSNWLRILSLSIAQYHIFIQPLHWAVDWTRVGAVRVLLEEGADSNTKDSNGNIPLHRIKKDCDENAR